MSTFAPVFFIVGLILVTLGVAMNVPALVDAVAGHSDWQAFGGASLLTLAFGGMLVLGFRTERVALSLRQGFLLTTASWIAVSAFGALPFLASDLGVDYSDAFFETVSGLTTTGATVLTGLDEMPPGILLWRALLQWLGGIGIIAMAVAMLPFLSVGGMQLFRMESSDRSEKVMPRPGQFAAVIGSVYLALSVLCAVSYWAAGMSGFEAVTHAMATVSTGGFSTSDASFAHFNSAMIELIAIVFMVAGSFPFVVYVGMLRGGPGALWHDSQIRTFLALLALAVAAIACWLWLRQGWAPLEALRAAAFNVVSVVTTTGFATADFNAWGTFPVALFFVLLFVGGCTGSTSGALKIFRLEMMGLVLRRRLARLIYPHSVFVEKYGGRVIGSDIPDSAIEFVMVYVACFAALAIALAALGLDLTTGISGAATAIGNVGPGLGPVIGPAGNFATMPDSAKWLLSAGMLLGRLEFLTVLVVLMPRFWRT